MIGRHKQRYLNRGKRETNAEVARRLVTLLEASGNVLTAARNVEQVVRTQLVPTVNYQRESLESFALAEFLAQNDR